MHQRITPKVVEKTKCPLCKYPTKKTVNADEYRLLCMFHSEPGRAESEYDVWKRKHS